MGGFGGVVGGGGVWARLQQKQEREQDAQWNQLQGNIGNLQTKLSSFAPESAEYQQTMNALTQAIQARNDFLHPAKNPGALQRFGRLLHLTKGPQAQSMTVQPAPIQVPATTAAPIESAAEPNYRQYAISAAPQPGKTAPLPSSQTMASPKPKGLVEPGNLPIWNRPVVQNADGTHSSEYSTSFRDEQGREVLVPTVVNGKFLTPDGKKPPKGSPEEQAMFKRAWQHYLDTGENLGKFDNAANANAYANVLHNRKAQKQSPGQLKAQAQSNAGQGAVPALNVSSTVEPGLPATTLPGMETPAGPALPAGPAVTVQGPKQTPGQLKDLAQRRQKAEQEAGQMAAAAPRRDWVEPELANRWYDFRTNYKMITGHEPPPDVAEQFARTGQAVEPKEMPEKYFPQLATTKDAQGKEHYWRIPMDPEKQAEEVDFKGQTMVPKAGKSVRAWKKDASGRIVSVLLDPQTNQPITGTEDSSILPPPYLTTRISTGMYHWVDEDNRIHETPETRTTRPVLPGAGTTPTGGAPPAPGAAGPKQPANPEPGTTPLAGAKTGDRILGTKGSGPLNKARSAYSDAVKISNLADQLVADAEKAHKEGRSVSEQDALFVLSLIRSEAGRVNQQEIAQLFNAGGIAEAPERWAAKVGHGELSTNLRKQLQDFTHKQAKAAYDAVEALKSKPTELRDKAQQNLGGGASIDDDIVNALNGGKKQ
jgi:hypothetical protein